jgi:type I restriction enzyme S subunit
MTPPGWERTTLGDLGRYINGRGFGKHEWSDTGRPIVRIQNLTGTGRTFNYYAGDDVPDGQVARPGDLLVSWAATLGAYIWTGPEAVINQHIFKVESSIDVRFHKYLLDHKLSALMRETHGSGMVHITRSRFDAVPVDVPPPKEQHRIVEILEDLLSRVDAGVAALEASLKRLRRIHAATGHQLMTHEWPCEPIRAIALLVTDGDHNPPKRVADGVPHITAKGIRNGLIGLEGCTYVSEDGFKQTTSRYAPTSGDVIVTCVGTIGEVAIVPPGLRFSADRNLAAIRVDPSRVLPAYLALALRGHGLQQQMKQASSSTAQPHLYLRGLRELQIPLPDIATQAQVVSAADEFNERALNLANSVSMTRHQGELLRSSLMAAAFSGDLTSSGADGACDKEAAHV